MSTHGTNGKELSAAADGQSENLGPQDAVGTDSDAEDNFHDTSDLPIDDSGVRQVPLLTGTSDTQPDASLQAQSNLATDKQIKKLSATNPPGIRDSMPTSTKRKQMPPLPIAKQKYETAMRELKEVLADFLDAYPADKPISDHDIPDAQERYYSIRQLQGPVAYAVKNLRPQLENNSKAEWNELDRELIDIESQIIGIKLSRGDVFSRSTSVTREVFAPDNVLQDRLSHPGSNTSQ